MCTYVWEQRKFGEIATRESKCELSSNDMPCVEYEDVVANEGQLNKDIFLKEVQKKGIVFDGSQVLYGKLRPYLHNWLNPDFTGVAVGDWWVLKPIEEDKNFVYRLIQTQQFDDVANLSAGSKMPRADWNLVSETVFFIPGKIEEQSKIARYFDNLDNLITLHQCKPKEKRQCRINAWEQRKFAECFDYLQNNTLSRADLSDEDGEILNVHYGDILVKFGEVIDIATESLPTIADDNILAKYINSVLQDGDVVIADAAEDETVGKCSEIKGCKGRKVLAGLHTIPVRPKVKYANGFLGYFMNSAVYHNQLLPLMQGTKVSSISKTAIQDTSLNIPSDIEEQKSIADYFMGLDNLITLHQRKLRNVCESRSLAWEQRKFGDLGSVSMCKRIFKEQTTPEGDIPFYKIGTFGGEPDAFISRELFEEYKEKFQYPKVGDMLISASGTIGRTVEYTGEDAYFQDSNIVWFKHDDRVDNSFLKCIYASVKWAGIEGSTIKRLYNDNFLKTEFSMPGVEEQQRIGEYCNSLDTLITLHQRQQKCGKNSIHYALL